MEDRPPKRLAPNRGKGATEPEDDHRRYRPFPPRPTAAASSSPSSSASENTGIMDERVLSLVFQSMNWDPHVVSRTACVSRRLRAVAKRVLWRELCYARAPRMVISLVPGGDPSTARMGGGWDALAKLFFYCCGSTPSKHFGSSRPSPGHFAPASRFSKTSGKSFLSRVCRGDLLYVSDPCEHPMEDEDDDIGVYRGIFRGFMRSRTRAMLVERRVDLDARVRCPYCGARVWSMTAARLVPRSASRRLGSHEGCLEYFVCVNGHLHGSCWLAHLSSDDDDKRREEGEASDDEAAQAELGEGEDTSRK